ncbi:MAG: hypothetical protein ACOYIA_01685 [Eubacteriales bacterium]|jgi:hypothetical protein
MKTGYKRSRGFPAALLCLFLVVAFIVPAASGTESDGKYIILTAPDIKSGESMVRIGDTRFIRYSIYLDEYKTLHYSKIDFSLEFEAGVLELYNTNIDNEQIFAYDVAEGVEKDTQRNIVWYTPVLEGNKINFSAYSTTGMWFRGPVIILYFLVPDDTKIGRTCSITLSDFSVELINPDGTPESLDGYDISVNDGTITVTRGMGFLEGETIEMTEQNTPFKGRGDPDQEETGDPAFSRNAPLQYAIAVIILLLMLGILLLGSMKIFRVISRGRLPKKVPDGSRGEKTSCET